MLQRDNSLLAVIDIQDVLMPEAETVREKFLASTCRLIEAARLLELPVLVTEQNPARLGESNSRVGGKLGDSKRIPKMAFSCLAETEFKTALAQSGCGQLLICGMETHICVMQTALEAQEAGFEVYVVRNAVVAREKREHEGGLFRLAQHAIPLVTAEMAIFELLRSAGTPAFKKLLPLLK
jgi:nicotinamidase-related amidase